MALISPIKLNIADKLKKDKGFRERFFRGQAQDEIAMSIRGLRKKRKMRQFDLAHESEMKQSAISRIEKADYSSWSFKTLFRVADALEARLRVTFEPIENVIKQYKEKELAVISSHDQCVKLYPSKTSDDVIHLEKHLPKTTKTSTSENINVSIGSYG